MGRLPFLSLLAAASLPASAAAPFFDPSMPVYGCPVDAGPAGVMARAFLLQAGDDEWVVFDQDLLRPALWLHTAQGKPPVSLILMSQASWEKPTQKGGVKVPVAEPGVMLSPALPGVGSSPEDLLKDPRPQYPGDAGRGGLEASGRHFGGYVVAGKSGLLQYECQGTQVREWYEADRKGLRRHMVVASGEELLFLIAAGDFQVTASGATSPKLSVASNHPGLKLETRDGKLFARLAAAKQERRVSLSYGEDKVVAAGKTPATPAAGAARWAQQGSDARIQEGTKSGPGWVMDRIGLPENIPSKRRVRPADLVFLGADKAAVVTFEGDVWRLNLTSGRVRWTRIAAGLCEPLSIEQVGGVLQVFTRNGIIRLRDTNNDGETDFYENYSSLVNQSSGMRGYPLDMEVDDTGRTWCSTGGIVTDDKGLTNKLNQNPHGGAILSISPDGKQIEVAGAHAREPFFARDPATGRMAMSEQQGHWVPSSGFYPVTPGADFGYGGASQKTGPAMWIPHDQDSSSASPLWVHGSAFKGWEGGLLDLSYGTGKLLLARPGEKWPATEGAVIPLEIDTGLPLLHGRTHPDGSLWLAGFRIYDSRAPELEGIARLRPGKDALATASNARVVSNGVVLEYDSPLDPTTVKPEAVMAKEWQYKRSGSYGSPRLKRDGSTGADPVATGATILSKDRKSVFIHIPSLKPTMQLELSCSFAPTGVKAEPHSVFFTVAAPPPADWAALGFDPPQLDGSVAAVHSNAPADGKPTAEWGKDLATRYGCIACHSTDGSKEGHSGPTWKGLYGSERKFSQGGKPRVADDAYLLESMLEPGKAIVEGYTLGMGSYSGILSEAEQQSIILFIRSLK